MVPLSSSPMRLAATPSQAEAITSGCAITSFKIVTLGESGVGKTQLIAQCHYGRFSERSVRTVGTSFLAHTEHVDDSTIQLALWDTAGLARFDSIRELYTHDVHAAIICYDMTDHET